MAIDGSSAVILPFHILGGILALITGYVALYATKGSPTHRKGGTVFVYAMIVLSLTGALVALLHANTISIVAGLMTFYMVATGMRTVQRRAVPVSLIDRVATIFALIVAAGCFVVGIQSAARGRPEAYPLFILGIVGLLGVIGDRRVMQRGGSASHSGAAGRGRAAPHRGHGLLALAAARQTIVARHRSHDDWS